MYPLIQKQEIRHLEGLSFHESFVIRICDDPEVFESFVT